MFYSWAIVTLVPVSERQLYTQIKQEWWKVDNCKYTTSKQQSRHAGLSSKISQSEGTTPKAVAVSIKQTRRGIQAEKSWTMTGTVQFKTGTNTSQRPQGYIQVCTAVVGPQAFWKAETLDLVCREIQVWASGPDGAPLAWILGRNKNRRREWKHLYTYTHTHTHTHTGG